LASELSDELSQSLGVPTEVQVVDFTEIAVGTVKFVRVTTEE
jgi:hypothetical protein